MSAATSLPRRCSLTSGVFPMASRMFVRARASIRQVSGARRDRASLSTAGQARRFVAWRAARSLTEDRTAREHAQAEAVVLTEHEPLCAGIGDHRRIVRARSERWHMQAYAARLAGFRSERAQAAVGCNASGQYEAGDAAPFTRRERLVDQRADHVV